MTLASSGPRGRAKTAITAPPLAVVLHVTHFFVNAELATGTQDTVRRRAEGHLPGQGSERPSRRIENTKTRKSENTKGTRPRPDSLNKDRQDGQDEKPERSVNCLAIAQPFSSLALRPGF